MNYPSSIPVEQINKQHPDYAANIGAWCDIDLLYRDGAALKAKASSFLVKKPRELVDVYQARLQRFTSRPILGTGIGWYQAAMFEGNPTVQMLMDGKTFEDDSYTEFFKDCNDAGKTFVEMASDVYLQMLLTGQAWVLTDREVPEKEYGSLAEQKADGALDVHLVRYESSQVINWETDDRGNLEWVLIYAPYCERQFGQEDVQVDRWYAFDTEQCAMYERRGAKDASLAAGYPRPHALSAYNRVPVRRITIPDGLWLGNRAYLIAKTHLDQVNALDWALWNGCLPVLWAKGYKDSLTRSEVGYIELDTDGDIGYLEPAGGTYKMAAENVDSLREEMYRQMYLQAQGRSTAATPAAQSGFSKEMDMRPSQTVLNGMADSLRAGLLGVLQDVADGRGDEGIKFTIAGLEFEGDDSAEISQDITLLTEVRLGPTVERVTKKRLASKALRDQSKETRDQAFQEIDTMPTDEEQQQAQFQQRLTQAFTTSTARQIAKVA